MNVYKKHWRVVLIMKQTLIPSTSDCHYRGGHRPQAALWLHALVESFRRPTSVLISALSSQAKERKDQGLQSQASNIFQTNFNIIPLKLP